MIQGTGSGVGKSVLTAALCRYFYLKGFKVAPFKAQNMSLNSFVTRDGREMGRAQAFQAEVCGIEPHVAMNPVLLKPSADNLSQVIVMGKAVHTRNAQDYYSGRPQYLEEVKNAFQYLSERHDLIILEGAGSPAEINLREQDFVNMPMAKLADAPVLLVGDIDRGGVFAWLKGTYDLLTPDEQDRVCGFIINKFRGDLGLLEPGLRQLEGLLGKPVLGVIPFDRNLFVDEEDSIPSTHPTPQSNNASQLDVVVIRFPRISNFTDFSPLTEDPDVSFRYVWKPSQLGQPDLIILPGTKNTLDDLAFLKEQGLDTAIRASHRNGSLLLGICGGYQMMGQTLSDPEQLESTRGEVEGMGLFELKSTLLPEKVTRQIELTTADSPVFKSSLEAKGYEIHMGRTQLNRNYPNLFASHDKLDTSELGVCNESGTLIGTYLHGFLDCDALRNSLLNHVRQQRELPHPKRPFQYLEFREQQWDRLSGWVEKFLDIEQIEKKIG